MLKTYLFKVLMAYFFVLGSIMVLRTDVFFHQLQALAVAPVFIFSLGFIGLIVGLALLLAKELAWFGRTLGLLITLKSIVCIAFPLDFCQWILFVVSPKMVFGFGMVYLLPGLYYCFKMLRAHGVE